MPLVDEQIKQRKQNDREAFEETFINLSSVINGSDKLKQALNSEKEKTVDAIGEILSYLKVKIPKDDSGDFPDMNAHIEYYLRPYGILHRSVNLVGKWYNDAIGPLLGQTKNGDTVALIPSALRGYTYFDYELKKRIKLNGKTAKNLQTEAMCFYKPLPLRKLKTFDFIKYAFGAISRMDWLVMILATVSVTLLGMFAPMVNQMIFSDIIPSEQVSIVLPAAFLLIGVTLSKMLMKITEQLVLSRINTKVSVMGESAAMARLLSLPPSFFKDYSAGELTNIMGGFGSVCSLLVDVIFSTGLTAVLSLTYLGQILTFTPALLLPALCIIAANVVISLFSTMVNIKITRERLNHEAKCDGVVYSLLSGIQKIKLSGSEKRCFAKWANLYKEGAELEYNPPLIIKINNVISALVFSVGTVALYLFAANAGIAVADFIAFNLSFGLVSAALNSIASLAVTYSQVTTNMEMIKPIMECLPETSTGKQTVSRLMGAIELNNISFRYSENMPLVIDNLSLKIKSGQYVAIVGETGCGKSTLMRLIMGFESPAKGSVYYDGKDLSKLDLKSLRRFTGAVMQNGKLFRGDIYSNIVVSAPWLTLDDAWKAAEIAGIADDIREMPMEMHTIISENGGGISGGQKQRLMIARAVASKPKILLLDEATSALDNITQAKVSAALDKLKCTRIVIAHRLSTIMHCDRIVVLKNGKISEDGTYDELLALNGEFAELVKRQRLDS